jgi:hypothetical protein
VLGGVDVIGTDGAGDGFDDGWAYADGGDVG